MPARHTDGRRCDFTTRGDNKFFFTRAVSDLTSKSGFWAKALSERHAVLDSVLFFYVDAGGDVHYGLNGESKGVFMQGIDTRAPLWVLLDIYGNSTIVEFLDCRPQLNNNRPITRYGVRSPPFRGVHITPKEPVVINAIVFFSETATNWKWPPLNCPA